MSDTSRSLRWVEDANGDALYAGETFIGCIYKRDSFGGLSKGWRVLDADLYKVIDITPEMVGQITDVRQAARKYLEDTLAPLPTAQELLGYSS